MALCFGKVVVPFEQMTMGDAGGSFQTLPMVDLTAGGACYSWLWKQLGLSRLQFRKGTHNRLPLAQEVKTAILESRHKRKRDGKFYNADDRPIAESLVITVRGQQLTVLNDARRLAFHVPGQLPLSCSCVSARRTWLM